MNDHSDTDDTNGDGEGVWSADIEQCFREALLLFPPCGRRKHILQEEGGGKMYGRNELIARHIMMRTGKVRTRKQVSSHIQVLARRKAKVEATSSGSADQSSSPASSMAPAASISAGTGARINNRPDSTNGLNANELSQGGHQAAFYDGWADRPIVTQKIRLVQFSAFIEYRQPSLQQSPIGLLTTNNNNNQQTLILPTGLTTEANHDHDQVNRGANLSTCLVLSTTSATPPAAPQATISPSYIMPFNPTTTDNNAPGCQVNSNSSNNNNNSQLQPHHQPLNNHQHHHLQLNQGTDLLIAGTQHNSPHSILQHARPSSTGLTRHSYVKIDYRQPIGRQTNKLERIDISQIQDKFPEVGGSEGLFQRGPPDAFFLVKFWADLKNDYEYNIEDQNSYFGFSSHFETTDPYKDITCSTKACSYGLQVVEKVEKIYGAFNSLNGRYSYDINRSPMCEFMIQFIKKLRQLPRASQMNSVLENFTVLQVITCESTSEILLCLAYIFEIASSEQNNGSQYHVYKLTKD